MTIHLRVTTAIAYSLPLFYVMSQNQLHSNINVLYIITYAGIVIYAK
ncbi:MAG: hypothetical protein KME32_09980 [Mojavia pulchra JT2-VF2]|uniref:Uncharacterized protein n=1 Tax=Mojavia pulchra JT2-VF2 TaxID=287848 RepID=A0A951UFF6_9NOST|nr:hypothetical protein [Mojavia pulchra JT2-VF2]